MYKMKEDMQESSKTKHITCGSYAVTVVENSNGQYEVSYKELMHDHPHESSTGSRTDIGDTKVTGGTTETEPKTSPSPDVVKNRGVPGTVQADDHCYSTVEAKSGLVPAALVDHGYFGSGQHGQPKGQKCKMEIKSGVREIKSEPVEECDSRPSDSLEDSEHRELDQPLTNDDSDVLTIKCIQTESRQTSQDTVKPTADAQTPCTQGQVSTALDIPTESSTQKKQTVGVHGTVRKRSTRNQSIKKATPVVVPLYVYKAHCTQCSKKYYIKISSTDQYVDGYLESGIKIHCTECAGITVSPVVFQSEEWPDDELVSPMFLCSHPSCGVSVYKTVQSLRVHRSQQHPRDIPSTVTDVATSSDAKGTNKLKLDKDGHRKKANLEQMDETQSGNFDTDEKQQKKVFKCPVKYCRKTFVHEDQFSQHLLNHKEGGKGCACNGCYCAKNGWKVSTFFSVECSSCHKKHTVRLRNSSVRQRKMLDIICNPCGEVTRAAPLIPYKVHKEGSDQNDLSYLCPEPDCEARRFSTLKALVKHTTCHSTKVIHCKYCQEDVKNQKSLRTHLPFCAALDEPRKCFVCGKVLRNMYHFSDHVRRRHKKRSMLCADCGETFPSYPVWKNHQRKHVKYVDGKGNDDAPLEKSHICPQCSKGFTKKTLLQQHTRRIHGVKDKVCKVCGMMFTTTNELTKHNFKHIKHLVTLPTFRCEVCSKTYRSNYRLTEHMKRLHGTKRDTCPDCGKEFKSRGGLRLHVKNQHAPGVRLTFFCVSCNKRYSSQNGFLSHMNKIHHSANLKLETLNENDNN